MGRLLGPTHGTTTAAMIENVTDPLSEVNI